MQVKRVNCPSCNALLEVKNTKNETAKRLLCPSCKAKLVVNFAQEAPKPAPANVPQNDNTGETIMGGTQNQAASPETQYGKVEKPVSAGELLLVGTGFRYPLKPGVNIVGRKATTSTANIQIDTTDKFVSRHHFAIQVVVLPGQDVRAIISNHKNINKTFVQNTELQGDDEIILTDGMNIRMGNTTLIYRATKSE